MSSATNGESMWSRKMFLSAMLSQTLGTYTLILLPQEAVAHGAVGHILIYALVYVLIGIPLLYMEYVTAQFTGRDCLEVWRARPFLTHIGYIQVFWQILTVIFTQSFSSFVLHYFLISFEEPIPYYLCGPWSTRDCNILYVNYTIHQDCLTSKERSSYCRNLCTTFPEYQYWRYYVLGINKDEFYLVWRISLSSILLCIFLFFSCLPGFCDLKFRKWVMKCNILYIITVRFLLLIGSMLQKGVVVKFEDALDSDFSLFMNSFDLTSCIVEVIYSLHVGTGLSFNIASKGSFRSSCYSNTVIVVVINAAIVIVGACSSAMMLCPYSFRHNIRPYIVARYPMFITYEMLPRLLDAYSKKTLWLVLNFSMITISYLCVNTITLSCLLDIISKRCKIAAKYPGLMTVIVVTALYLCSIPLLYNKSLLFSVDLQRGLDFLQLFLVLIECFTFLIFYGLGRFCEDVHFMLGVQPKAFVKVSWILSIFVLMYVTCMELHSIYMLQCQSLSGQISWWFVICVILFTILVALWRLSKAFYKKRVREEIALDHSWGPKSDLLKRSRAMFTTHAMTKEYIYRQYHLQAGILLRQKRCNIRN